MGLVVENTRQEKVRVRLAGFRKLTRKVEKYVPTRHVMF